MQFVPGKGEFTLANFARNFALSLHILLNFFFISKHASLLQNRLQNHTNVNAPLE
jgi:hypothetical protein